MGAGIEFETVELVRRDGFAFHHQARLVFAQAVDGGEDFAFELLEQFERDVQEIAGTACGVEHADGAELVVEGLGAGQGSGGVAGLKKT